MINMSFDSMLKMANFWKVLKMRGTIQGVREIQRSFGALSSLISLPFCSTFAFDFYGRSKSRDVTVSVPLSFFFFLADSLGAIVALKFICRKLF